MSWENHEIDDFVENTSNIYESIIFDIFLNVLDVLHFQKYGYIFNFPLPNLIRDEFDLPPSPNNKKEKDRK